MRSDVAIVCVVFGVIIALILQVRGYKEYTFCHSSENSYINFFSAVHRQYLNKFNSHPANSGVLFKAINI